MGEEEDLRKPLLQTGGGGGGGGENENWQQYTAGVGRGNERRNGLIVAEGAEAQEALESRFNHAITILGEPPVLEKQAAIDPFKNKTPHIRGLYEWTKTILMLPVLVLRILMTALVLFVGLIATKTALAGYTPTEDPMPKWRRRMFCVTRLCGRAVLFCFG